MTTKNCFKCHHEKPLDAIKRSPEWAASQGLKQSPPMSGFDDMPNDDFDNSEPPF